MRAAIDIGSNTIHIVVARATTRMLDIVADEVELVRIGESVTATGQISPEKCAYAMQTLEKYKALAEQHGAQQMFVVATEAIRQAENSAAFIAEVQQRTGLEINLISGEAEASLTFLGATYEAYAQPNPPDVVGVMDLGGGSLELVTARQSQITWKVSVPIGSGWLHDRYLAEDPPDRQQIEVAETFLQTYLQGMRVQRRPPVLIVTGGSANSLLHLAHRAFRLELHHTHLTVHDLLRCQGILSALPAEEISLRYEQPVERARILLAGACIITAMMTRLRLDEIHVSPHGIREGVLLAYARYGERWLARTGAAGAARPAPRRPATTVPLPPIETSVSGMAGVNGSKAALNETFIQAGWRMIRERLEKLLEWPDEVLKDEDVEAVHKMRVASRRLRATLDAFESLCRPKVFKRAYRSVAQAADRLGAARDTDVMIANLRGQLEQASSDEQPGIQWLIERLQSFRQEKQRELDHFLRELDRDVLTQQVKACIREEQVPHG
jgi:exopolyphosphatase / guanosine-5'-triphosphate,3'-diphosphate pyrophosphatase